MTTTTTTTAGRHLKAGYKLILPNPLLASVRFGCASIRIDPTHICGNIHHQTKQARVCGVLCHPPFPTKNPTHPPPAHAKPDTLLCQPCMELLYYSVAKQNPTAPSHTHGFEFVRIGKCKCIKCVRRVSSLARLSRSFSSVSSLVHSTLGNVRRTHTHTRRSTQRLLAAVRGRRVFASSAYADARPRNPFASIIIIRRACVRA